jgi:hypothetical protein
VEQTVTDDSSNSLGRKKLSARFPAADERTLRLLSSELFSGNVSRCIERAVLELAYDKGIHQRPEGFRHAIALPSAENVTDIDSWKKGLRATLKVQGHLVTTVLPPGKAGRAYRANPSTVADLLVALRSFPRLAPPPRRSRPPVSEQPAAPVVNFSLTVEHNALLVEVAAHLGEVPAERANVSAAVLLAVREKAARCGFDAATGETDYKAFPLPHLAGRYPEEHFRALLQAWGVLSRLAGPFGIDLDDADIQRQMQPMADALMAARFDP